MVLQHCCLLGRETHSQRKKDHHSGERKTRRRWEGPWKTSRRKFGKGTAEVLWLKGKTAVKTGVKAVPLGGHWVFQWRSKQNILSPGILG